MTFRIIPTTALTTQVRMELERRQLVPVEYMNPYEFQIRAFATTFLLMALYALDGLIYLIGQEWLGVGFHAFALFCLFRGFKACRALNAAS